MESGVLESFRTLGLICSDKSFKWHREGDHQYISFPLGKSFLTYDLEKLKIRYIGPQLTKSINSLDTYKDRILLASGKTISSFHKIKLTGLYSGSSSAISEILVFADYLLALNYSAELIVWNCDSTALLSTIPLPSGGLHILHPPTYLNKVLISTKKSKILLINVKTGTKVYDFPNICKNFNCSEISAMENAVALDIVVVGLENGRIFFVNIMKDEVLFSFDQEKRVTSLSVCSAAGAEVMASGTQEGTFFLWDLKERKIQAKVKAHNCFEVTKVLFVPNECRIITSSGMDNSIKQWVFDFESPQPRVYKSREGFNASPHHIRFYNNDHILSCADNALQDLSLLNEHQNIKFSSKGLGKVLKSNINSSKVPVFNSFSFATARERDWCNVVSCHGSQSFLWSYENKTIGNRAIERKSKASVGCSAVSECGNFGAIGLVSGEIEKFNMQSGFHQFVFQGVHDSEVIGLEVDSSNTCMVSASKSGQVFVWDFFTGKLLRQLKDEGINGIRFQKSSNLLLALLENACNVYDIRNLQLARSFSAKNCTDAAFSPDSRWLALLDDSGIQVWDLPSIVLIDWVSFKNKATSLDFSPDGKYLATSHQNSLGIFLWLNKSFYTQVIINKPPSQPRKIKGFDVAKGKNFYSRKTVNLKNLISKPIESSSQSVVPTKMPKMIEHSSFKVSDMPYSRISSLYHLDEIKERNTPIETVKKPEKVPFFLPDSLGIVKVENKAEEVKEKKEQAQEKDLANMLGESGQSVVEFLKTLSPGRIELNFYGLTDEEVGRFIEVIYESIMGRKDFDFLQSILSCFLRIHSDKVTKEQAEGLEKVQSKIWREVEELFLFDISGLERLIE